MNIVYFPLRVRGRKVLFAAKDFNQPAQTNAVFKSLYRLSPAQNEKTQPTLYQQVAFLKVGSGAGLEPTFGYEPNELPGCSTPHYKHIIYITEARQATLKEILLP